MISVTAAAFKAQLNLKPDDKDSHGGVFYFEGTLTVNKKNVTHEIYGFYHDQSCPQPHYVWIMHSPTLDKSPGHRSASYWEKQITIAIKQLSK